MPNSIISEGKTTNEAIENGLKMLHANKNQVEVKVLENEDKRSFFSILAPRVVKVELTLKEDRDYVKNHEVRNLAQDSNIKTKELRTYSNDELEAAEKNVRIFLNEFMSKLSKEASFTITKTENGIDIDLKGEEIAFLIGYRGETLYSMQNILSAIASKGLTTRVRIILDIEGYKEKREKTLEDFAERMEKQVIRTRKSVTLEPMKAYERKIIHSKLQNSDKVTTYSIGEEPRRRIVISLKK